MMVLVVGHNLDWKKIFRISRMEMGQVNRLDFSEFFPSGKGANTARALNGLGEKALLLSYSGGDNGRRFRKAFKREGLHCRFVRTEGETRTCITILEDNEQTTELIEPAAAVSAAETKRFFRRFLKSLSAAKLLVIVGTSLPASPEDCYKRYVEEAKKRRIPTILDSYRLHGRAALEAEPEVLKINLAELENLEGERLSDPARRKAAFRQTVEKYNLRWIVITRGAKGSEGYDGSRYLGAVPPPVRSRNPIGSGDAVTAGIGWSLLHGEDLEGALRRATALGTANCLNLYPGRIDQQDYEQLLEAVRVEPI